METRQKTQYRVFVLALAHMRGNVDAAAPLYVFDEIEKLKDFYNAQLADAPWQDTEESTDAFGKTHSWHKVFKKGSLLEWYNPLDPINQREGDHFNVVSWHDGAFGGVLEDWVDSYPTQEAFNVPFNPISK